MKLNKILLFMFILFGFIGSVNAVLNDGVAYYSFDADTVSGTTLSDLAGSNDGTCTNMGGDCNTVTGLLINSSDFDNSDDFISMGTISGDWKTISLWVNPTNTILTSTTQENPFGDGALGAMGLILGSNTGSIPDEIITLRNPSAGNSFYWTTSDVANITNDWHQMVFVFEGSSYRLFYDGVDKGLATNRGSPTAPLSSAPLNIGSFNGQFWDGEIDEFGIWNRSISNSEVAELFNSGAGFNPYIVIPSPALIFTNITANNITLVNNTFYNTSIDFETMVLNTSTNANVNQSYSLFTLFNNTQQDAGGTDFFVNVNSLDEYCSQQGLNANATSFNSSFSGTTAFWSGSAWVPLTSSAGSHSFGCFNETVQYATNNLNGSFNLDLISNQYLITFTALNNETNVSSNFTFSVDKINPVINNNIPSEINSYDFDGSLFSCTDTNLASCNVSINGFNEASGVNFTLINNGNLSYNITAIDLGGNTVIESGVVLVNPLQLFNFQLSNGSTITNFILGGLNFTSQANISTYNSIISLGNNTLLFEKLGFASTNVTFNLNTTSIINLTTTITSSKIVIRIFNRETNVLLTGLTMITLQATIGFNGTTTTGLLNISNINFISEQYQILAEHEGFNTENVFFNYDNQELINIDIFMLNTTAPGAGQIKIIVKNSLSQLVESAVCSALEWRPSQSAFLSVAQGLTNVNGETLLNIELNTKIYEFSCTKDAFTTVTNAQIVQIDDSSLTIILNDVILVPTTLFPNLATSLTNTTINATHQLITYTFVDSDGLTTQGCLQVFLVNGNRQNLDSETCVSSSTGTLLLTVNANQTSDILIQGTLTTSEVINFVTDSLTILGTGDIAQQLKQIGLDVLLPTMFMLLGLGLGILLSKIELGVVFMGVGAWAAVAFVPTILSASIAMFITVVVGLMLWLGFNRK